MNLDELSSALDEGNLDKASYIEFMYEHHKDMFRYADLIDGSDVEAIRIGQGQVFVQFKWPPIKLEVPRNEMRAAPVEAVNFGAYEKEEFAIVERIVASLPSPNPVVVDIGGNVGFYSIGLKALHPNLKVHAFEPVPATASAFSANCELNGFHDISLHRCALSDHHGEATFFVHKRMSVAASQQNILGVDEMEEVTCKLIPLDDLAGEIDAPVEFIKCDVEGAELFAFRGATKVIERDQPVVFSEMLRKWSAKFDYHPNEIIAFFKERGYACHALRADGTWPIEKVTDLTIATNFIFLHAERHESIRFHS
jgi:FkbM family methyltransferase